jgi:membrane dipeptidase
MVDSVAQLHRQAIIIDGHNDSLPLRLERGDSLDLGLVAPRYHVDLPRMLQGGLTAMMTYVGGRDLPVSLELWQGLLSNVESHPELVLGQSAAALHETKARGQIALIPQLESCSCLGHRLGALELMARLGLRVANLTHGEGLDQHETALQVDSSEFGYCTAAEREAARRELRGLTDFGREVIAAASELNIIVDLAHANDRTFYETLEASARPCIFSHGCVFAICPHWRGLTDDQIRALAANGGVMGVAFYRKFIDPEAPSMDRLLDQVEHVLELVGPDHLGFGADYDGLPEGEVPIPPEVGHLQEFTAALLGRGLDEETVLKILGGNYLRVMATVCGPAPA